MNTLHKFTSIITLIFLSIAFYSCETKKHDHSEHQTSAEKGKEYTSAYVCPMHCEGSGSEEPGKCPVCEMDYVKNEEHSAESH